jgi:hypothetical protein
VCHDYRVKRTVDYSALIFPIRREDVAAFKQRVKQSGSPWNTTMVGAQAGFVIALVVIVIIAAIQIVSLVGAPNSAGDNFFESFAIVPAGTLLVLIVVAVVMVRALAANVTWELWFTLDTFARANGFAFSPASGAPHYTGAIFGLGARRQRLNNLVSVAGRAIDMGNYRYVTKSGKNSTTHNWGYLALELDRKLPHMVLDSRANNGIFGGTNLPTFFAKNQALSLEGDFDKYFTLYCPKHYERDALYVFTPDLMALMIDEAAPFDVEIVDNWMFVYSPKPFASRDPHVYQRLFRIIDTVGAKTLSQTDRYADDRLGDPALNLVAPSGQRLKRGISATTITVVALFAAFWLFFAFGGIFL